MDLFIVFTIVLSFIIVTVTVDSIASNYFKFKSEMEKKK